MIVGPDNALTVRVSAIDYKFGLHEATPWPALVLVSDIWYTRAVGTANEFSDGPGKVDQRDAPD
jgi:hypothetical protein